MTSSFLRGLLIGSAVGLCAAFVVDFAVDVLIEPPPPRVPPPVEWDRVLAERICRLTTAIDRLNERFPAPKKRPA